MGSERIEWELEVIGHTYGRPSVGTMVPMVWHATHISYEEGSRHDDSGRDRGQSGLFSLASV